jgi:hypothetical protein
MESWNMYSRAVVLTNPHSTLMIQLPCLGTPNHFPMRIRIRFQRVQKMPIYQFISSFPAKLKPYPRPFSPFPAQRQQYYPRQSSLSQHYHDHPPSPS